MVCMGSLEAIQRVQKLLVDDAAVMRAFGAGLTSPEIDPDDDMVIRLDTEREGFTCTADIPVRLRLYKIYCTSSLHALL